MQLDFKFYLFGIVVTMLVLGFFLLLLTTLFSKKQQKNKAEKLKMQNEYQQSLIEVQEQTLTNISQEIHDNVGQVLSLAKLNLNRVYIEYPGNEDKEKISSTVELITKAIEDLRALSKSLNGEMFVDIGLHEAVKREVGILQKGGFINAEFISLGKTFALPRQTEVVIYRIVQECIQNAIKHSSAKNIATTFKYQEPEILVTIADDGKGFSEKAMIPSKAGLGLRNMKSRAAHIGTDLKINSAPGKGTQVNIHYAL